jgi:N utilization substance protein B
MGCSIDGADAEFESTNEMLTQENEQVLRYDQLSRRDVRSLIFHLLYALEAFDYTESLEAIIDNFNRCFNMELPLDGELFKTTDAILKSQDHLDETYKPLLSNWRIDRISVSTKLILRLATWELLHTDMDPRIIINEAVELAKCFAEKDAFKFINGVLDGLTKKIEESKQASGQDTSTQE